ncbi:MAG TPA: FkbM family methyltransferase [Terriglobales bacterium]|jgi:FkbM family methyltransferase|nr:FkbM family methyltransferase [Terriglobales bacterium]
MKPSRRKIEEALNAVGLHPVMISLYRATLGRKRAANEKLLRDFYAPLLKDTRLIFDIGANLGKLASVFSSLGARVIAVEPNNDCVRHIQICYPEVEVLQAVAGPKDSLATLNVSDSMDATSSLSNDWINSIRSCHTNWDVWNRKVTVPMFRLDTLIEHYGFPDYIKIDVEGFEEGVLAGLSRCPRLLSFEYNLCFTAAAYRCITNPIFSGARFNYTMGENESFQSPEWMSAEELVATISKFKRGDVYGDIFVKTVVRG